MNKCSTCKSIYTYILIGCIFYPRILRGEVVSAYLRVKDEIKTIEACLESIDGIFDKIVIIHSNEKDDGSVAYMRNWCAQRAYCQIHEYPYAVIPAHSQQYRESYREENSLAAYYNFGLKFFAPEEWVVKIDGDQIYLSKRLKEFLQPFKEGKMDGNKLYGLTGYNTFVRNNELVFFKKSKINGGSDSFVVKRKNIKGFRQENFYEKIDIDVPYQRSSDPMWFHFMKTLKSGAVIQKSDGASSEVIQYLSSEQKELFKLNVHSLPSPSSFMNFLKYGSIVQNNNDDASPRKLQYLTHEERFLFELNIRPLLVHSPYYKVKIPVNK